MNLDQAAAAASEMQTEGIVKPLVIMSLIIKNRWAIISSLCYVSDIVKADVDFLS